jgi:hypothetical protein
MASFLEQEQYVRNIEIIVTGLPEVITGLPAVQMLSSEPVKPFVDPVLETDPEFLSAVAEFEASNQRCKKRWGMERAALAHHFDRDDHFGHNCRYWNQQTWNRLGKKLRRFKVDRNDYHKELAIQTAIIERYSLDRIESQIHAQGIKRVADEFRHDIEREEATIEEETQSVARPQMTADELHMATEQFILSCRKEEFDHRTMDDDWDFPNIIAATKLNIAAERKRQRRLIATYGNQIGGSKSILSDAVMLEKYQAFLRESGVNPEVGRLSDEQVEARFQFLDQELHHIHKYASDMEFHAPYMERTPYYRQKWQEAKDKHDELTTKYEEFISRHGRDLISDLI